MAIFKALLIQIIKLFQKQEWIKRRKDYWIKSSHPKNIRKELAKNSPRIEESFRPTMIRCFLRMKESARKFGSNSRKSKHAKNLRIS